MTFNEQQVRDHRERVAMIGDMHLEFERQFEEFNFVIPYKYNWDIKADIFSPQLYSLLQGINSANDGILRMLGSLFALQPPKDDAFNFMVALNDSRMLALQAVAPLEKPEIIKPYADLTPQKAPTWWTGYNKTKHTLPEGMKKASLDNVINALGALLILLQISYTRLLNSPHKAMLQSKNWRDVTANFVADYDRLKFESATSAAISFQTRREYLHSQQPGKYRSSVFYYLSEFHRPVT